ncbi:MAG: glycosyltransferase family 4 protein, partial [Verrucomicrobiota bacterium]
CTLQGEDSFLDDLPEPYREKSWAMFRERTRELDGLIAVSDYFRDLMKKRLEVPDDQIHLVYNGIALDDFKPRSALPDPPVIGFMARLCRTKGLETLIDAFLRLRKDHPTLRLHAAGAMTPGDEKFMKAMREKLDRAGVSDDVTFSPNISRDDKIEFLRGLTVLSVPASYGEGFGLYVLEALASGVPVVQPNHAAFPELIEATSGGLLCEPENPASLAEHLATLLDDSEKNRQLGERGREAVTEKFSVRSMAEQVLRVYQTCLS